MRLSRIFVIPVLIAMVSSMAVPVQSHVTPPTVTAQHAIVGDPLFGFSGPNGALFTINPDDPTQMASTTKSWTLHVAIEAVNANFVGLTDTVTISNLAGCTPCPTVPGGSSLMGVVPGEQVQFGDLLRGMMYPSGNDAAIAVAEHVAQGKLGPGGTWQDFVAEMNLRALVHGLVNTHFTNPAGLDCFLGDCTHGTTAREMARWFAVAIKDPLAQQIMGFVGTYSFTTQLPGGGPKSYSFSFPFFAGPIYPGFEGGKGGGTANCNGPNNGCMVMSAVRIGRRLVLATMQGQPWVEETPLFDYGFAKLFHPDYRGQSAAYVGVRDHDLECMTGGRAVSAVIKGGAAKLLVWDVAVDEGSLTKVAESGLTFKFPKKKIGGEDDEVRRATLRTPPMKKALQPREIELAQFPGGTFVTATRKMGTIELARWTVGPTNKITLVADGYTTGPSNVVGLQPTHADMFLLQMRAPNGTMVLQSWQLGMRRDSDPLILRDTHYTQVFDYVEVRIAGPGYALTDPFNDHRAVTFGRTSNGLFVDQAWAVAPGTGEITLRSTASAAGLGAGLAIARISVPAQPNEIFGPIFYASAFRIGSNVGLRFYRLTSSFTFDFSGPPIVTALDLTGVRIASWGPGGLLLVGRQPGGNTGFAVFEATRSAADNINPLPIVEHASLAGTSFEVCDQFSPHADRDFVVARITSGTSLKIAAYRVGDRP